MAIRMVDDQQDNSDYQEDNRGGGGRSSGGGGSIFGLLPILFFLIRKPGGWLILLLVAAGYFLLNQQGCGGLSTQNASQFSLGGQLNPNEFAKAPVYEGLSPDDIRNPLPEFVSLGRFAPPRKSQGQQGSCVAWSSAYAAHSILVAASAGTNPTDQAFSPAYLYNQIGLSGCQGSYIQRAMELMNKKGSVPFNAFPYDENNCTQQPSVELTQLAAKNRLHGYNRLTTSNAPQGINIRAIKEHLAKEAPVVIGMMVGGSFMEDMMGKKIWQPTESDYQQLGFGGHAMCVIGYDDRLAGGAFQIMNSWGTAWGENGIGWVRYADFKAFTREAYGLDPLPRQGAALRQPFDCEIGLVAVDGKGVPGNYIALQSSGANNFTSANVKMGSRFKIEVKNTNPCYVYVFGQEADGSSYTLFPYPLEQDATKTAYSPYCGITGYRLFPKNKSMMPDEVGKKDFMAVVVSSKALNWFQLNQAIDKQRGNYALAVRNGLANFGITSNRITVEGTGKGNLHFTAQAGEEGVAFAVVEVNKQ